jgi:putative tryptophan/tyrosine transport system substrate-binding protein
MAIHIRRREFTFTLGGAAVAWPLAARAQQRERMRRIGVLIPIAADDPERQARIGVFGLEQLGCTGFTSQEYGMAAMEESYGHR